MHEAEADAHGVRYLYRPVDLDALNLDGRIRTGAPGCGGTARL